jgi:hypothetical protein
LNTTPNPDPQFFDGKANTFYAGTANTTGLNNSFFGSQAGTANNTGYYNSFFGFQAGRTIRAA